MSFKIMIAAGLAAAFALPAAAQQSTPSGSSSSSSTSGQQHSGNGPANSQAQITMQQHVKNDLEQAGFKNVQVMPESFLVRATDKEGRPVMMVINPDSITTVTGMSSTPGSSASASGSSSSTGGALGSNPSHSATDSSGKKQ